MTGAYAAGLNRADLVGEVRQMCNASLANGATVIVAVSGGPDSTALAYLLSEARPDLRLFVAHVRHGLRDDEADARMAARHAAALEVGYLEQTVVVGQRGAGPEGDARQARYAALTQMADQVSADGVVVGHSADDQAETVLLNIARGSGLQGVSAMAPVRDLDGRMLVRPLLRIRRGDLRAFIAGEGLQTVQDPTNTDESQRRARVRSQVMPALARLSGGSGDPVGVLTRLADLARADASALDMVAVSQAERIVHVWGDTRCVRYAELEALPVALATRIVRTMVLAVRRAALPDAQTVDMLLRLESGEALDIAGGVWATSGAGWLGLRPVEAGSLDPQSVAIPGTTPMGKLNLVICADTPWGQVAAAGQRQLDLGVARGAPAPTLSDARSLAPAPLAPAPPGASGTERTWLVVPAELTAGLRLRTRAPGDRLRTAGGTRKLQDLFTDQGVPRAVRDLIPVVVDADDEPLWIPGVAMRHLDLAQPAAARLWLAPVSNVAL